MGLRNFLDRLEPDFHKGGRFSSWYALFEAVDTFLYSPGQVTKSGSHVRDGIDLKRIMITVWLATFPAMFYGMYNLGWHANTALVALGQSDIAGWRGWVISLLAGHDPANWWHNLVYGLSLIHI